jgi:isopenicillin N synthase-like dioxygenase
MTAADVGMMMMGTTAGAAHDEDIAVERALFASGVGAAPACTDGSVQVPVIDMSATRPDKDIAADLMGAANTIGFFTVVNHGIAPELIEYAFRASARFFAQPRAVKEHESPFARHLNCGYEFMSQVRPSTGTADQKETMQITARAGSMDGRWPTSTGDADDDGDFRSISERFLAANLQLARRILTILQAAACPHLSSMPPGLMADSHTLWGEDGQCTLRYLHYPPIAVEQLQELLTPDADGRIHWRAGPHTDWDNITLLYQQEPGLECCANPRVVAAAAVAANNNSNNNDNQKHQQQQLWIPVDPVPGAVAVNIGDMLARWSDGTLYSNLHRVRMPTSGEASRYSIAFFAQSDRNTMICTPNSDPISAGDYLLSRIQSNFAK